MNEKTDEAEAGSENGNANLLIGTTARSAANSRFASPKPANREIGVPNSISIPVPNSNSISIPVPNSIPSSVPKASAPVWHREYWDRYIRNGAHFRKTLDYIHQNPVSAKFVTHPEDWPWSSARRMVKTQEPSGMKLGLPLGTPIS